jgi:hypothetical protein
VELFGIHTKSPTNFLEVNDSKKLTRIMETRREPERRKSRNKKQKYFGINSVHVWARVRPSRRHRVSRETKLNQYHDAYKEVY